jgi:hypothetical protein
VQAAVRGGPRDRRRIATERGSDRESDHDHDRDCDSDCEVGLGTM